MKEMQAIIVNAIEAKTQVQAIVEIEIKRQEIANTKNLFRGSSHCYTSPPSPL